MGKPLAGKTGTSSDSQSVWFIGFSPDLAAGVYVGFDNPRTLGKDSVGQDEQGATVSAPIFRDFMKAALADAAAHAVPRRAGHRGNSGQCHQRRTGAAGTPGAIMEAFKAGTAPGEANAPVGGVSAAADGVASPRARRRAARKPAAAATSGDVGEGTGGLY